ncbi:MAG: AMP-binding protein [Bacteroidales bacterium]|nr:AMP-binding protein [Bacteroidales bacterium]
MDELCISGITYNRDEILRDPPAGFASETPFHHQLYLFLKEWFSPSSTIRLHTSGSTGVPKEITVLKEQLLQSAKMTCDFFQLKRGDRALLCLPLDYIAGKMMVVRAIYAGLNLYPVEPSGHPLAERALSYDFAAMVPLQVCNTLQSEEEKKRLSQIRQLIIGGGAVDEELQEALKGFPNDIYSTYGMTETLSHIALRRINGVEAESYYTPLPGVGISVSEENTLIADVPLVSDVPVATNDIVVIREDGTFRIIGRRDNVINSGGIKVQTEEVEEKLGPFINGNYAVTSLPHPKLGQAIVLLIEPAADPEVVRKAVKQIRPRYLQPLHIFTVKAVPLTGSGKIDRTATLKLAKEIGL